MALCDSHKSDHGEASLWGIVRSNGVRSGHSEDERRIPHSALFALVCRLNHACKANARYGWRQDLGVERVVAVCPIAAGEEVCVQYRTMYAPRVARQAQLFNGFNFMCTCGACQHPSDASDERMVEIRNLLDEMQRVGFNDASHALVLSERLLRVMHQEGVATPHDLVGVHEAACELAIQCNDMDKTRHHLSLALECARLSDGTDSPRTARCENALAKLTRQHALDPPHASTDATVVA